MRTLGHPLYLIGIGCDLLAWVGSMIALRELAVYLVESILAGSLAVTVVAARVILKSRLRKRDIAAVVVSRRRADGAGHVGRTAGGRRHDGHRLRGGSAPPRWPSR